MTVVEWGGDLAALDTAIERIPDRAAVFLLWPREGPPYLSRTVRLRRRLRRMLRMLNLRDKIEHIEYYPTGSWLESSVRLYQLARIHFPDTYVRFLRLRPPSYVKLTLANPFPRTTITTHLGRGPATWFGPFRSRASAEAFESHTLDLFQVRRCAEDLAPSPEHPGCIYGEMGMCLRPCQQVVGPDEYAHEVGRLAAFLSSRGASLVEGITRSRDRASEELQFEEAARQHKRLEKVQEVLEWADELARDLDRLHGVAITPSVEPQAVALWWVRGGHWLGMRTLTFEVAEGKPVSIDRKLRETIADVRQERLPTRERQEYLALLARWFYSSWRDGEWVPFEDFSNPPYRKLVHAISRVAHRTH